MSDRAGRQVADGDSPGPRGPDSAQSVGQAIADISEKIPLLVHEEIELAKAEITTKVTRLIRGAAAGLAAGFFVLLAIVTLVQSGAWGLGRIFGDEPSLGFLAAGGVLVVFALVAGLIAAHHLKDPSPVPEMAIEEARKTKEMIESKETVESSA